MSKTKDKTVSIAGFRHSDISWDPKALGYYVVASLSRFPSVYVPLTLGNKLDTPSFFNIPTIANIELFISPDNRDVKMYLSQDAGTWAPVTGSSYSIEVYIALLLCFPTLLWGLTERTEQIIVSKPIKSLGYGGNSDESESFLKTLKVQNVITTPSVGIYFQPFSEGRDMISGGGGSIAFGGIDAAKFNRSLLRSYQSPNILDGEYRLQLRKVAIVQDEKTISLDTSGDINSPVSMARLNFSYPQISLPNELLKKLNESYIIAANFSDSKAHFSFKFEKSLTIMVPLQDLRPSIIEQLKKPPTSLMSFKQPAEYILGATFFRAAYIHLDYHNKRLNIAPTIWKENTKLTPFAGIEQRIVEDNDFEVALQAVTDTRVQSTVAETKAPTLDSDTSISAANINSIVIAATIPGGLVLIALGVIFWLLFRERRQRPRSHVKLPESRSSWNEFFNRRHATSTSGSVSDGLSIHRNSGRSSGRTSTVSFDFGLRPERSSYSSINMGRI
ncbi:hypothetical protein TWF679_007151 [Orbilia oligospora]|uniref:Peptidase A1 domain-containing protein n=1 Tax=Orbilia oligospora TaxID=2813651 RepID=A0A8H8V864_ORBOL|nr:hypothetical protein TWF679_007151 [Orbilia oligospora]